MKHLYDLLAEKLSHPDLLFLNYGYAEAEAKAYDWMATTDRRHRYHLSLVRHVLGETDLTGQTVLEIGSGRGGNCDYLSRYTPARRVVGIDFCAGNVRFSRKTCRLSNVTFIQGDARSLPFADERFDVVLSLESSHSVPDLALFLSEASRVLKPLGVFCYADVWNLDVLPYDWGEREKSLKQSGFAAISEEDISERVFEALESEDGAAQTVLALATPENAFLVDRFVKGAEALRVSLATGLTSYKVWRLRKP